MPMVIDSTNIMKKIALLNIGLMFLVLSNNAYGIDLSETNLLRIPLISSVEINRNPNTNAIDINTSSKDKLRELFSQLSRFTGSKKIRQLNGFVGRVIDNRPYKDLQDLQSKVDGVGQGLIREIEDKFADKIYFSPFEDISEDTDLIDWSGSEHIKEMLVKEVTSIPNSRVFLIEDGIHSAILSMLGRKDELGCVINSGTFDNVSIPVPTIEQIPEANRLPIAILLYIKQLVKDGEAIFIKASTAINDKGSTLWHERIHVEYSRLEKDIISRVDREIMNSKDANVIKLHNLLKPNGVDNPSEVLASLSNIFSLRSTSEIEMKAYINTVFSPVTAKIIEEIFIKTRLTDADITYLKNSAEDMLNKFEQYKQGIMAKKKTVAENGSNSWSKEVKIIQLCGRHEATADFDNFASYIDSYLKLIKEKCDAKTQVVLFVETALPSFYGYIKKLYESKYPDDKRIFFDNSNFKDELKNLFVILFINNRREFVAMFNKKEMLVTLSKADNTGKARLYSIISERFEDFYEVLPEKPDFEAWIEYLKAAYYEELATNYVKENKLEDYIKTTELRLQHFINFIKLRDVVMENQLSNISDKYIIAITGYLHVGMASSQKRQLEIFGHDNLSCLERIAAGRLGLIEPLSIEQERASINEQFILDRLGGVESQVLTVDKQKQINKNI